MEISKKYCPDCGNTGVDIEGNVCHCRFNAKTFYDTVSCFDVPEQYRGLRFNGSLVASDMPTGYVNLLQDIQDKITLGRWEYKNVVLASPIGRSKTILAYSCLEQLFRDGCETFPVFDVLELKRMLLDMDLCRPSVYDIPDPQRILTVPVLFTKIPRYGSWEVYDTITTLLDRRVRRGNSTIFIYDGSWAELTRNDKKGTLTGLMGDGYYNTLDVQSWAPMEKKEKEIQLEENLG